MAHRERCFFEFCGPQGSQFRHLIGMSAPQEPLGLQSLPQFIWDCPTGFDIPLGLTVENESVTEVVLDVNIIQFAPSVVWEISELAPGIALVEPAGVTQDIGVCFEDGTIHFINIVNCIIMGIS